MDGERVVYKKAGEPPHPKLDDWHNNVPVEAFADYEGSRFQEELVEEDEEEAELRAYERELLASTTLGTDQVFVCVDFAQIEARVVAWLAGQKDILDVFASGQDVYVYTANQIGSDNRQLGKVCVLGLGFGMGFIKFVSSAKSYGLTITEEFAERTVRDWRDANHKIVKFWYALDDAFRRAIVAPAGSRFQVGYVTIERGKDAIGILLPNGKRRLIYRNPRLEPDPSNKFHGTSIVFDGVQQWTKKYGPVRTYGGKLAENITQAVARDVLAHALLTLDAMGVDLRLTVHDEIIAVADAADGKRVYELVLKVMRATPDWAPGLPVGAEGWFGRRYRK